MHFARSSGILLHPTSLPGPFGIGDLGPPAHSWIDFLGGTGTGLWQVLPLGPTGYGDSPYQCFSAFAGNPYLISPELLLEEDFIHSDDLADAPDFPADRVDYGRVIPWKLDLLNRSFLRFRDSSYPELEQELHHFQNQHRHWLPDYALFMALKEAHGGQSWVQWPEGLRDREESVLASFRTENNYQIQRQVYFQFLFFRQWSKLRKHADQQGIQIIGDIPIFVAHDSADVWVHRELFDLDQEGQPTVVAGVPPDYFSETGQRWGNPLYNWEVHKKNGYRWWMDRLEAVLSLVDIVRLDHFRGFAGYWEIPAEEKTAVSGRWRDGPGADFFRTVQDHLGELPIIAEDLGEITPDVTALRNQFQLPGMKVLVFAFDSGPENEFLPHNYTQKFAVYTGTHDNDTALGWYQRVSEDERDFARRYLNTDGNNISWDLIRAAWSSVAVFALAPMQDLLGLDNQARMNYPGNERGNWTWRLKSLPHTNQAVYDTLSTLNQLYSRESGTEDIP